MVYLRHARHQAGRRARRRAADLRRCSTQLGIPSEFRGGYRVTTPEAIEVVRDGARPARSSRELVELHQRARPAAPLRAISGEDAGLFRGRRRGAVVDGEEVDLGLVGDVVEVDPAAVLAQLAAGRIPVVSSIAPDRDVPGQSLNVNADSAAAALAVALGAAKLVILTDVAGLYRDWPNRDSLVSLIDDRRAGERCCRPSSPA